MALTDRILVASASRHGATAELARVIGDELASRGFGVDVRAMAEVDTVYPYDAYVLGSAVYLGSWLHEARDFLVWHRELIARRPTWLFSSGPIPGAEEPFDAEALLAETGACDHHLFGGKLERGSLNRRERVLSRLLRVDDGDFRDWEAVSGWAATIAGSLVAEGRSSATVRA